MNKSQIHIGGVYAYAKRGSEHSARHRIQVLASIPIASRWRAGQSATAPVQGWKIQFLDSTPYRSAGYHGECTSRELVSTWSEHLVAVAVRKAKDDARRDALLANDRVQRDARISIVALLKRLDIDVPRQVTARAVDEPVKFTLAELRDLLRTVHDRSA